MSSYAKFDMRGNTKKKLTRAQRAECRAHARRGATMVSLARMYGCSTPVIVRVVNNNFKFKDNLDSDDDHMDSDVSSDCSPLLEALETAAVAATLTGKSSDARRRATKDSASSLPSTKTAANNEELPTWGYLHEYLGLEKLFFKPKRKHANARGTSSSLGVPTPLSVVVTRKRKPDERGGTPEASGSSTKVARTRSPEPAVSDSTTAMFIRLQSSEKVNTEHNGLDSPSEQKVHPDAIDGTAQPPDAGSVSSVKTRLHSPEVIEILSDDPEASSARPVVKVRASSAGSTPSPTSPISPTTPTEGTAVASFLSSQKRDLSRLLPTFIELGIRDDEDIASLRDMPREENKKWFDELVEQGKLTPFEAYLLLCALHS